MKKKEDEEGGREGGELPCSQPLSSPPFSQYKYKCFPEEFRDQFQIIRMVDYT